MKRVTFGAGLLLVIVDLIWEDLLVKVQLDFVVPKGHLSPATQRRHGKQLKWKPSYWWILGSWDLDLSQIRQLCLAIESLTKNEGHKFHLPLDPLGKKCSWSMAIPGSWMEVPTIHKAYVWGLCKGISPKHIALYTIWYNISILGSWRSPIDCMHPFNLNEVHKAISVGRLLRAPERKKGPCSKVAMGGFLVRKTTIPHLVPWFSHTCPYNGLSLSLSKAFLIWVYLESRKMSQPCLWEGSMQ